MFFSAITSFFMCESEALSKVDLIRASLTVYPAPPYSTSTITSISTAMLSGSEPMPMADRA